MSKNHLARTGVSIHEFFYPRDWRAFTVAQFIDEVDAYIRWYNETRIKMSLGGRSPIEYRKSLGLTP